MDLPANKTNAADWKQWHEAYERADSSLARRLIVIRQRIAETFDQCSPGTIRVVSVCAGDGHDHPRAEDVRGRLVELDATLAERAQSGS